MVFLFLLFAWALSPRKGGLSVCHMKAGPSPEHLHLSPLGKTGKDGTPFGLTSDVITCQLTSVPPFTCTVA
jgi:hypothetical protein